MSHKLHIISYLIEYPESLGNFGEFLPVFPRSRWRKSEELGWISSVDALWDLLDLKKTTAPDLQGSPKLESLWRHLQGGRQKANGCDVKDCLHFVQPKKGGVCSLLPFWRSPNHFRGSRFTSDDSGVTPFFWSEIFEWTAGVLWMNFVQVLMNLEVSWKPWWVNFEIWRLDAWGPMTSNRLQWGRPLKSFEWNRLLNIPIIRCKVEYLLQGLPWRVFNFSKRETSMKNHTKKINQRNWNSKEARPWKIKHQTNNG